MLTDNAIKAAKPRAKAYKMADGEGLTLLINPNGSKWWRFRYRIAGVEKTISFGVYPDVPAKLARERRQEARTLVAQGIDPSQQRQAVREARAQTFEAVAKEWYDAKVGKWAPKQAIKVTWLLEKNLNPWLGAKPIGDITPVDLLSALRRIESRGALETAKRTRQVAGQVFRYAVATGRATRDPSPDLRDALKTAAVKHLAAIIEPKDVGPLLRALDVYQGTPVVRAALRLAPLTFVRPGELRQARWKEFDLDAAEWRIPASRMKMKIDHIVPLSKQAVEILENLQPLTGRYEWVFPSGRSSQRPMSENAVLSAMRRSDISKEEMCGHGFRAMARTILDEVLGYRVDWIEHQLAHAVKDVNGRAYNRTAHLAGRKQMMQGWADYLDKLRAGNVVSIKRSA
jgi:integrase